MTVRPVQKSLHGPAVGIDLLDNLAIGGTKLYWGQTGPVQGVIDLSSLGSGGSFSNSVTVTLAANQNNYMPAGWNPGVTNRVLAAAFAGNSTVTGLIAANDGFVLLWRNTSATDTIIFAHNSSSSSVGQKFSCPAGGDAYLPPLTNTLLCYITNVWTFL